MGSVSIKKNKRKEIASHIHLLLPRSMNDSSKQCYKNQADQTLELESYMNI